MKKISRDQVLMLHPMVINQSVGIDGIRDNGLLESALNTPFQSFNNEELYPSIQGKADRKSVLFPLESGCKSVLICKILICSRKILPGKV